jgi:U3 small nucleolar RNA-associated protein 6
MPYPLDVSICLCIYVYLYTHLTFLPLYLQIQRLLERMIPELEDLQEKTIFSPAEVKSIVKKRTGYEYKFKRQHPQLNDFLSCIQYELTLDKLRHKRKKNLGIRKVLVSDFGCKGRVHFAYERALRKFGADVELWLQYIGFAERSNSSKQLGKIFPRALQMHPNKPELWVKAALWEFRSNQNVDAARVMFQRGLRFNKGSQGLWLHFFKMEMEYIMKLLDRKKLIAATFNATNPTEQKEEEGEEGEGEGEEDEAERRAEQIAADIRNGVELNLDAKDKAFLSGIIPTALYNNAITSQELKDNLSFRLKFLDLIPNELLLAKVCISMRKQYAQTYI